MKEFKFQGIYVEVRQENNKDAQLISLDKAMKIFKHTLEKENILQTIKERRYYTKPSALEHAKIQKILRHRLLQRRKQK